MVKTSLNALKPTPLSIILVALGLLFQTIFFSSSSTSFSLTSQGDDSPDEETCAFGVGSPILIITANGTTGLRIRWAILALNLAATYAAGVLIAGVLTKVTKLRRPATVYGVVAAIALIATFFVSIIISKRGWGYYIARPDLLSEVSKVTQVKSVIPFKTETDGAGKHTIVPDREYSLADGIKSGKQDSYYCLNARILIELERKHLLPSTPTTSLDGLPELYPLIESSGALAKSSKGYDSAADLSGIVVDAVDGSGGRLVLLGLTGGQLSNDHYPYYEMLFRRKNDAPELLFVRSQRFFYDVAGMEGFEWYSIWIFLSPILVAAAFVILTLSRAVWKWKSPPARTVSPD